MIKPYDIVSAPYTDLTGDIKKFKDGTTQRGLFLVLTNDMQGNVLACKITSQYSKYINKYCYTLTKETNSFLQADSFIQLDKWHTLNYNECKYIGSVPNSLRLGLLKQFDIIIRYIDDGLKNNIHTPPDRTYVSPNTSRLNYLLEKEKCTALDKSEILELYRLRREI